jgi:hypothetical protein
MKHLVDRFREGRISVDDFDAFQDWLNTRLGRKKPAGPGCGPAGFHFSPLSPGCRLLLHRRRADHALIGRAFLGVSLVLPRALLAGAPSGCASRARRGRSRFHLGERQRNGSNR